MIDLQIGNSKFTRFTCSSTWMSLPHLQKMHNSRFKSHEPSHRHLSSIGLHCGASIGQAGAPHLSGTSQSNQRVKSHLSPLILVSIYLTSSDLVMNLPLLGHEITFVCCSIMLFIYKSKVLWFKSSLLPLQQAISCINVARQNLAYHICPWHIVLYRRKHQFQE